MFCILSWLTCYQTPSACSFVILRRKKKQLHVKYMMHAKQQMFFVMLGMYSQPKLIFPFYNAHLKHQYKLLVLQNKLLLNMWMPYHILHYDYYGCDGSPHMRWTWSHGKWQNEDPFSTWSRLWKFPCYYLANSVLFFWKICDFCVKIASICLFCHKNENLQILWHYLQF